MCDQQLKGIRAIERARVALYTFKKISTAGRKIESDKDTCAVPIKACFTPEPGLYQDFIRDMPDKDDMTLLSIKKVGYLTYECRGLIIGSVKTFRVFLDTDSENRDILHVFIPLRKSHRRGDSTEGKLEISFDWCQPQPDTAVTKP